MGSFNKRRVFDPLDLVIIDQVYKAAWAQIEAREPFRDKSKDSERAERLRKRIFVLAGYRKVDFDNLFDRTMESMAASMPPPKTPVPEGGGGIAA